MINPFLLEPYTSKELFCDREQELNDITSFLKNGSNVTLISPRRYGKTGLIFRTFDDLREKNFICIYADIFSAQNLDDFIKILSEAVVSVDKKILHCPQERKTPAQLRPDFRKSAGHAIIPDRFAKTTDTKIHFRLPRKARKANRFRH